MQEKTYIATKTSTCWTICWIQTTTLTTQLQQCQPQNNKELKIRIDRQTKNQSSIQKTSRGLKPYQKWFSNMLQYMAINKSLDHRLT